MITPLTLLLVAGALVLPLLGSIALLAVSRLSSPQRIAKLTSGIAALSTVGLLLTGEQEVPLPVWLPGAGHMSLHLGGVGTQAAALTTVMLFVGLLIMAHRETRGTSAVLLAALVATNASFLAGHFLFRYLALEMVGLCIGLAPLLASRGNGLQQAKRVYLLLRLGDAGLLATILILWQAGDTLDIGPAIQAGMDLNSTAAAWTVGGLLLAVWVKAGLWPFHSWQGTAHDLPPVTGAWLYGLVMPNLGLYLLYRTIPLLSAVPWLRWTMIGLAVLGAVAVVAGAVVRRRGLPSPVWLGALFGAIGALIAAFGASEHLALFLLVTTPFRVVVWLTQMVRGRDLVPRSTGYLVAAVLPPQNSEGRIIAVAKSASRWVEVPLARKGIASLWMLLLAFARWLNVQVERRIAQEGITWLWQRFAGTAQTWYRVGEQQAVSDLVRGTTRGTMSVSHRLGALHTGRLRVNLRWAVVAMALLVLILLLTGW